MIIDIPKIGQIWQRGNLQREVISVDKRSDRENDYNITWRRPGGVGKTFVIWLPYWKQWCNKAALVLSA